MKVDKVEIILLRNWMSPNNLIVPAQIKMKK